MGNPATIRESIKFSCGCCKESLAVKIRVISDIHAEFFSGEVSTKSWKAFEAWLEKIDPRGADTLLLAGDIGTYTNLGKALRSVCSKFRDSTVLYVPGNHEFYGPSREDVLGEIRKSESRNDNFYCLDGKVLEVGGIRFIGTTLWFRDDPMNQFYEKSMQDFFSIPRLRRWVYEENKKAVGFLENNLEEGMVLLTHHMPTSASVPERFKSSSLNRFFVCDLTGLILQRSPALCAHGHTHDSCDFMLDKTRIVCNPYGYYGFDENEEFDPNLAIEIPGSRDEGRCETGR